MADEFGEKTEAPSQKRLKDAVKKGDILKSREFATALVVLAGVVWIVFFGPSLVVACKEIMTQSFRFGRGDIEDFQPFRPLVIAGWKLLPGLGALFAITVVAGVLSQAGLGSLGFNAGLMAPKGNRINPASGLKRMFGMNGWMELGKSLLKVALLGTIGVWLLMQSARVTLGLARSNLDAAVGALGGTLTHLLIVMAMGLAGIALIDVPLQMFQRLKKLRMSKQEQKDEHKESEGNPEVKGQIRAKQRAILSRSTRKSVAEAHVVLTNPTHFAVALRYDRGRDSVPVVVAKGRGAMALAIRSAAGEMAVPVLEYPMLARAVYYTSREGQEVRDDLYLALATVLAFVFGLNERMGGTAPLPAVDVPAGARFDENGVALS
ncbi:EscU/YscU/HrcU family type III secretion system export apparatus switch protein [Sphingomonas radiodurans]|uniref:EscU/YscU/HrcU family type III secretion system export apparatus switch protein n=1 Tax=Sphingomonas radiodurans TaxID=2890321 RepID=UPI001E3D7104|nr:flagellar type III secretion system protein FlhB [Sphingomonas radiodurans]WBH15681.1 flagellar type III secretion system protein FlhB [Sphingomonas radiodurans]